MNIFGVENTQSLVGKGVRATSQIAQIPRGTTGTIIEVLTNEPFQGIVVEWNYLTNDRDTFVRIDGLDQTKFLELLEPSLVGAGS